MSYILDALRRADAERERGRGTVPGLHSANLAPAARPNGAAAAPSPVLRRTLLVGVGALGAAVLAALVAWGGSLGREAAMPSASAPPAVERPAPMAPAGPPAVPVAPTVVVAAAPAPAPAPAPAVSAAASLAPAPPRVAPVAVAPAAGVAPAPTARVQSAAQPARAVPWSQLTPVQRQDFPALSLGGSVWSEQPASRFVLVNGQVVREGQAAAPGVIVERIEPRAVVLRWRDGLVEMPL
jgi:general secretion pathway protein B